MQKRSDDFNRFRKVVRGSTTGAQRLNNSMAEFWIHPKLRETAEKVALTCETCQVSKLPGKGYGRLPPREAFVAPWHEIAVDLLVIGPWSITDQ